MEDYPTTDSEVSWIPYLEREEWKDVTAIYPSEAESSVVAIAYSAKCESSFPHGMILTAQVGK